MAAGASAGAARADGDPASDYLISQKLFLPFDAKVPAAAARRLTATIDSANRQGFKIRVAIIWSDYDLGSVVALWKQPRRYARFLGVELSFFYKGPLLIVMPNGLGFNWVGHDAAGGYRTLAPVSVKPTPVGLTQAAIEAVQRLAAAGGVTATTTPRPGETTPAQSTRSPLVIIVAVVAALLLGAALLLAIRRRAARLP